MQDIGKIPVEMNKTLDENYLMIKEHCHIEMYNKMMHSLLDQKLASHIRLQYLYNIRQWDQNLNLNDSYINQLEINIINNIEYLFQLHYDRVWVIIRLNTKINRFVENELDLFFL